MDEKHSDGLLALGQHNIDREVVNLNHFLHLLISSEVPHDQHSDNEKDSNLVLKEVNATLIRAHLLN